MKIPSSFAALLVGTLLCMFAPGLLRAQESPALPGLQEYRQKALQFLQETHPELKSEDLEFCSIDYSFQPQPRTHKVVDPQGGEQWVADSSFTQTLSVLFRDRSTRTEKDVDGKHVAVFQLFFVGFNETLTEAIRVSNGTSTQYLR